MLDRPTPTAKAIDYRSINLRAAKHFHTLYFHLVDFKGKPLGEVRRLNPDHASLPKTGRLNTFRRPNWDGSWVNIGDGAAGKDMFYLLIYLSGGCDRRDAAEWLGSLTDRLVEVPS